MNDIDKIISRIDAEAKAEAKAIITAANVEATAYTAKVRTLFEAELNAFSEACKNDTQLAGERIISAAHQKAKQMILAKKQALISAAFDAAARAMNTQDSERYLAMLAKLYKAAAPAAGKAEIVMNAQDGAKYGKQLLALCSAAVPGVSVALSAATRPLKGGFVLVYGDIEVNCEIETLLRLKKSELSQVVANALFN